MKRTKRDPLHEYHRHEPDLGYWLEHIVHWHALLVALIAFVTVNYINFY